MRAHVCVHPHTHLPPSWRLHASTNLIAHICMSPAQSFSKRSKHAPMPRADEQDTKCPARYSNAKRSFWHVCRKRHHESKTRKLRLMISACPSPRVDSRRPLTTQSDDYARGWQTNGSVQLREVTSLRHAVGKKVTLTGVAARKSVRPFVFEFLNFESTRPDFETKAAVRSGGGGVLGAKN